MPKCEAKPWDVLREPPPPPKELLLRPGKFRCEGSTLLVELLGFQPHPDPEHNSAQVRIGGTDGSDFAVQAVTARVLSGFFAELAEQLDKQ